ncbi:MAG TPA: glycosyltransferase family 2 protein, partial [Anaerolineales bacterium]|nr:glycosyltransferase family 2 protein [Anaerolineales bacterium]
LIGSNALIRRSALKSIEGYRPGLAEDLATSIALHAAGWGSVYIAEPLAPGIAPPDLTSWFTQQLKWSRGVFELLLTDFPRYFRQLQAGHKIMYAVRMTYYWIGLFTVAHLIQTLLVLWSGSVTALERFESYLFHLAPLIGMTLLIRQLALRRWSHPSIQRLKLQWKPTVLVFATWPIYTVAWLMAIFRIPLRFQSTPKSITGQPPVTSVLPQLITSFLLLGGLVYTYFSTQTFHVLVFGFALAQIVGQLYLVSDSLSQSRTPASSAPALNPIINPVSEDGLSQ